VQTKESAEERLIRAFIAPKKRQRWLELLRSPNGRKKLRANLAHCECDLDSRYAHRIEPNQDSVAGILAALQLHGAGATCVVLSENAELDGCEIDLSEALERVVTHEMGSFLSVKHGQLAYFEGEDAGARYILVRSPG